LIGCGGGGSKGNDLATGGDMTTLAATTTVSGFTIDIDLLAGTYAMMPNISASDLIAAACVKSTPVYALYADGTKSDTVMADTMCNYTVTVKPNVTVHMVADHSGAVLTTYSQDETIVGTTPVPSIPAHVCTSNSYAAPAGMAALLTIGTDQIAATGIVMFGTNDVFTPPFVKLTPSTSMTTATGFVAYGMTNPASMPPTFVQQADSPIGIHAFFNKTNTTAQSITINSAADSGPNTYVAFMADVKPGFITFAPENPN
jgi:hypothetical protein